MKYKPTKEECQIIRHCAQRSAGCKRIRLEPGERYNLKVDGVEPHLNIARVTRDKDWDDTDLHDMRHWLDFKKGFEVADPPIKLKKLKGVIGIIDFYVYSVRIRPGSSFDEGELETNVTAYFDNKGLAMVEGTGNGVMYQR